ncbi:MAG: efflux RND transporter periplasmic adaptor subunit [Stagnimonas sp.]|nr:efflux RND transporter periplasmic adaptor subunit [Stagnimonas sp.]
MKWLKLLLVVVVIVGVIVGIKACQVKKTFDGFAAMGEPKATVTAVKIGMQDWNPSLSAIGSLRAVRGVEVSPEVSGQVQAIQFNSGSDVKKGEVMVQLNADTDIARLGSLQATLALAETTLARSKAQREADILSQAALDNDAAAVRTAAAAVREQQALVAKKTIRAPFAGKAGITIVNPGQYLNPGDKIASVQQLDPIYVDFNVPQNALSSIGIGQTVNATTDAGVAASGTISAIEPLVDSETRNVKVQATLKNADAKLLPGMFTKLQVAFGEPKKYLTLPNTAVAFNPYGETVYVVVPAEVYYAEENKKKQEEAAKASAQAKTDGNEAAPAADAAAKAPPPDTKTADGKPKFVAKQTFITTGPTRGDQVAVLTGLKEGDEVVTSGQLKLKNGLVVLVDNTISPTNDEAPKPKDE